MSHLLAMDRDESFRTMAVRMNEFRKRNELVDFTLINELGDQVKGHMIVLALSSPVIKLLVESFNNERTLLLRHVSAEAMEQLVSYIYMGEFCILAGAEQLGLTTIETLCLEFILAQENLNLPPSKKRRFG